MTISREQVADLRPGDGVEFHSFGWPIGHAVTGPLYRDAKGTLRIAGAIVRFPDGDVTGGNLDGGTLTVISRAPRPLYVNHDRTEPVPGDVVREEDPQGATTWLMDSFRTWQSADSTHDQDRGFDWPLRLLVDGTTGEVVK